MPRFSVEFYVPRALGERPPTFTSMLETIMALAPRQRTRGEDDPLAILDLQQQGHNFFGEAARIRIYDLPPIVHTGTCAQHDLEIQDAEGLAEKVHFLYDSNLNVIAIQKKLHLRASALQNLLGELGGRSLDFHLIITEDASNRFRRMDLVSKVNFKLARPNNLRGQRRPSIMGAIDQIDQFGGVTAKIEISVGRERRSLIRDAVQDLVRSFEDHNDSFKSLSLTGAVREEQRRDAPAHVETVDFIQERLEYAEAIEGRGRRRRLTTEDCRVALGRAILAHADYLRDYR